MMMTKSVFLMEELGRSGVKQSELRRDESDTLAH